MRKNKISETVAASKVIVLRLKKDRGLESSSAWATPALDYSFRMPCWTRRYLQPEALRSYKGEFPKGSPRCTLANCTSGGLAARRFLKRRPRRHSVPTSCTGAVEVGSVAVRFAGGPRARGCKMISRGRASSVSSRSRRGARRRFEPGKEGQARSAARAADSGAGLDCYRWDARACPYLENANLISVRTAEDRAGRP